MPSSPALTAALLLSALAAGCGAAGTRPGPARASLLGAPAEPAPPPACGGQRLEYGVATFVLEPTRTVELSCVAGQPIAVLRRAPPPAPVECECEEADEEAVELALDLDEWERLWAALEAAGATSLGDCPPGAAEAGPTHRLRVEDRGTTIVACCTATELPVAWARVVAVLDELEASHADPTDPAIYWPFEAEYWRDELGYRREAPDRL